MKSSILRAVEQGSLELAALLAKTYDVDTDTDHKAVVAQVNALIDEIRGLMELWEKRYG